MLAKGSALKSVVKVVVFLLVLALAVSGISRVLMMRDSHGTESMETFYAQPEDSIDVLFIGSSHVFENINTGVLWDEQGIAAYSLTSSVQPLWNTYYYVKEALKTQRPELIVLDIYRVIEGREYMDHSRIYGNTFGLKPSMDKLSALEVSTSNIADYLLGFPVYHSRYSALSKDSFLGVDAVKDRSSWKGYVPNFDHVDLEGSELDEDVADYSDISLYAKSEEYLRKTIELIQEEGIPLLVVNAPYDADSQTQALFQLAESVVAEYDVPYITLDDLYEASGLTFTGERTDLGSEQHLNTEGAIKYSSYLGRYIKAHYDIPDRRGDEAYVSWQTDADNVRAQLDDAAISDTMDIDSWFEKVLLADRFTLVAFFSGTDSEPDEVAQVINELKARGLDVTNEDIESGFVAIMQDGNIVEQSSASDFMWTERLFSDALMVKMVGEDMTIRLGYSVYAAIPEGVTAFLYDNLRGASVDAVSWLYDSLDQKENMVASSPNA